MKLRMNLNNLSTEDIIELLIMTIETIPESIEKEANFFKEDQIKRLSIATNNLYTEVNKLRNLRELPSQIIMTMIIDFVKNRDKLK